jgi:glycosyltransferase involved in cell wall biosynthesis
MRITFIIPNLFTGGVEIQAITQANELVKRGVSIQFIVLSDVDVMKEELAKEIIYYKNNVRSLRSINYKSILGFIFSYKRIAKEINLFDPNHVIAFLPPSITIVRIQKFFNRINAKIWPYHHSTEYLNAPLNSITRQLYHFLFVSKITDKNEHHLFVSKAVENDIKKHEKTFQGDILMNAIKLPSLNFQRQQMLFNKYGVENNSYIIIPGRLHPVKGHLFFLNSVKDLIINYNLTILIAGFGSMEKKILEFVVLNKLNKNVIITGHISNEEILELISGALFCVIPSQIEGLGNVAIESLAVGTTVLCSNAGGLVEVIENNRNGYIFEKENQLDLYEKFEKLICKELKLIEGEKLKEDFLSRFTVDLQIDRLLEYMKTN